jgi:hypothetical protein
MPTLKARSRVALDLLPVVIDAAAVIPQEHLRFHRLGFDLRGRVDATRIAYELDRLPRQRDANNFTPERTKWVYLSWRKHKSGPLRI